MCCCCKCCSKVLKIICSVIWIIVAVALIIAIIIFAVAWGGSKVMQDVMTNMINCGINSSSASGCDQSFGAYIEGIAPGAQLVCLDVNSPTPEYDFGWKINFDVAEKGLGVFARSSDKGIKNENENIFELRGKFEDIDTRFHIDVPVNNIDEKGNIISDPKKQYIIHDRYMHINAFGICDSVGCPAPVNNTFVMAVDSVAVHLRISFKSVPDFVNITVEENNFKYGDFVKTLHSIVKVFSKSAADSMKEAMEQIVARVTDFQNGTLCPISPDYILPQ